MRFRVTQDWGRLVGGTVVGPDGVAGCNIRMLVARGVLVPVPDQPTSKPVAPAKKTARVPKEL